MNIYQQAVRRAAEQTTAYATAEVQSRALSAGWDEDVAVSTEVRYTEKGFEFHTDPNVKDRAFVAEFGNEEQVPNPVLRRFDNDSQTVQELFLSQAIRNIEEVL